jgi:hypothetical protein
MGGHGRDAERAESYWQEDKSRRRIWQQPSGGEAPLQLLRLAAVAFHQLALGAAGTLRLLAAGFRDFRQTLPAFFKKIQLVFQRKLPVGELGCGCMDTFDGSV